MENAGGPIPGTKAAVMAICYDFDHTLTPEDMQAQGFIQGLHENVPEFWDKANVLAREKKMDSNLAYMYLMVRDARVNKIKVSRKMLVDYGRRVRLYPGVESWFDRINAYGRSRGFEIEHYIISSGLEEMIEGTSIARAFTKIYANSFLYDEQDNAVWPAQMINFTNKTQFLFRIEKGALDVNDPNVNTYYSPEKMRIPFRNIVYIGDSQTDIPCMKLVNSFGGWSIGVYDPSSGNKSRVYRLLQDRRIRYFAPADYTEGTEMDLLIKQIIDASAASELLHRRYAAFKEEAENTEQTEQTEHVDAGKTEAGLMETEKT